MTDPDTNVAPEHDAALSELRAIAAAPPAFDVLEEFAALSTHAADVPEAAPDSVRPPQGTVEEALAELVAYVERRGPQNGVGRTENAAALMSELSEIVAEP